MPGARWFEGAELNYAENMLCDRRTGDERDAGAIAVLHASELRPLAELTWGELSEQVAAVAGGLRALGVERGDRVVAYMPNIPETLIAFLATASVGAIWSCAAPEFGARSVIDRFAQIEPKVMLAVDGYRHGGKDFDRRAVVGRSSRGCPPCATRCWCPTCSRVRPGRRSVIVEAVPQLAWPGGLTWETSCSRQRRVRAAGQREPASSRCPSTIRCGCCTPRARPACRRRSCTATAGSCWSS